MNNYTLLISELKDKKEKNGEKGTEHLRFLTLSKRQANMELESQRKGDYPVGKRKIWQGSPKYFHMLHPNY